MEDASKVKPSTLKAMAALAEAAKAYRAAIAEEKASDDALGGAEWRRQEACRALADAGENLDEARAHLEALLMSELAAADPKARVRLSE